jgi:tetratricopeptide (TPR) repeat protein
MSRLPALFLLGLLASGAASAQQEPQDPTVASLSASYEYGKYAEVLERAAERIDRGRLTEADLVTLHKLAGLSAFNLNRVEEAARHFRALLRLEPDFNLDPFMVPPPTVAYLDDLRRQMAAELDLVRQEQRLRQERERNEAERRDRERVTAEEQRRRLETLSRQVTVRQVEKRSFLVNFVPFGAGQFQQGRSSVGTLLAASEGALALTSVISFFAYEALYVTSSVEVDGVRGPTRVSVRYVPTERKAQAETLQLFKWGSAIGFYAVYALGVTDSLLHHQDQVVQTSASSTPPPRVQLHLSPTSGGASAGLTLPF